MKSLKTFLTLIFFLSVIFCYAQSTKNTKQPKKTTITDEDLKKYAVTLDSIEGMQKTLQQIITENVQQNTVMSVARYNELYKIGDDQAALAQTKATPEEIGFLKEIADLIALNIGRINATYQTLAKDYVGLKAFNTIKKSLESDSDLKNRYNAVTKDISTTASSESN
jgi:Asp-tRNA(Asn)/Glu-tRNA(Gln) amidotransferase C subunit